jgi:hypothetical protein
MRKPQLALALVTLLVALLSCQPPSAGEGQQIARFPIDSLDGVLTSQGVLLDTETSSDGNGAIRIEATEPTVVRLYEVPEIDVENARLSYSAQLRAEDLEGSSYLEMWCHFDEAGNYFSRGLADPLTGSVEWVRRETPFFLQTGENPDRVSLNLVVEGRGTVWIDDITLVKSPL